MRRGTAAVTVGLLLIVASCGTDRTAEFLAARTTTSAAGRPVTSTTIASSTPSTTSARASATTVAAFPVFDIGAPVTFEQRVNGVSSTSKYTLKSMQWSTVRGTAGGSNPTQGAYLIATVHVECVTGVCSPLAGRFIFHGVDGRLFYASGPIANGYVPALGYAPPIQKDDLARPLTAGQSITGIAAIDTPRIGGVVYLVAVNTSAPVTTFRAPNNELRGAIASWSVVA